VAPARKRASAYPRPAPDRPRWTPKQERLALLYNEQGLRPDEIAAKLGISRHLATQIVLAARSRGKR
jgi:DNA-binding CsgD family transcriptional regulator